MRKQTRKLLRIHQEKPKRSGVTVHILDLKRKTTEVIFWHIHRRLVMCISSLLGHTFMEWEEVFYEGSCKLKRNM
jgi:hypothetical protein